MNENVDLNQQIITEAEAKTLKKIKAPNLVVIGRTGVGKSSLINAVFGSKLAETGAGLPVTQGFHKYSNNLIHLYDSAGYEVGAEKHFLKVIFEFLSSQELGKIEDKIHLVWYVINAPSARIESFDLEVIRELNRRNIPIVIVLSQCDRANLHEIDEIKAYLSADELTKGYNIIETSASPLLIRGKPICDPFGLEELVNKTIEMLPDIYADAVRIAQIVSLKAKKELAWKLIATAASIALGSSFIPVPTSGVILGLELELVRAIAQIYEFDNTRDFIKYILTTKSGLGIAGISLVTDLVKTIVPIVGNVLAGASAATIIVITGLAYTLAFEATSQALINLDDSEEVKTFFVDSLQKALQKYSSLKVKSLKDLENVKKEFDSIQSPKPSSTRRQPDFGELITNTYERTKRRPMLTLALLGFIVGATGVASSLVTIPEFRCNLLGWSCPVEFKQVEMFTRTEAGELLGGVKITVFGSDGPPATTQTDDNGYAQVRIANKGDVRVTLSKSGYPTQNLSINLENEQDRVRVIQVNKFSQPNVDVVTPDYQNEFMSMQLIGPIKTQGGDVSLVFLIMNKTNENLYLGLNKEGTITDNFGQVCSLRELQGLATVGSDASKPDDFTLISPNSTLIFVERCNFPNSTEFNASFPLVRYQPSTINPVGEQTKFSAEFRGLKLFQSTTPTP